MNNRYTEQDINLFFERFKLLPVYYELERVHQLINNPDAKAMHTVKIKYKPFKFIIMTSAFIVGVAAIIISLPLKNTDQDQTLLNAIQVESTKPMPLKEIKQDEILKETIDNHNFTADESNLKSIDLPISEKNPIPTEPGIEAQSVLINSSCYL